MRQKFKKLTSICLAIGMVISMSPTSAFAEGTATPTDSSVVESTEESTEDVTEATTEVQTEGVNTEQTTEALTEATTEAVTEEVTTEAEAPEDAEVEEVSNEPIPTFDQIYDGVSIEGIDFSSCELLIATEDTSIFTADTEVVSNYENIYLTRFNSVEATTSAYTYYYNKADLVEVNSSIKASDNDEAQNDSSEDDSASDDGDVPLSNEGHGEADLSELNNGDDAFSNLDDMTAQNYKGYIALIDTGAEGDIVKKSVSVIGDTVADNNGHGTKMANAIAEANPDAKILSIKALDSNATGSIADVYAAIQYAIDSNVSVINLSMSSIKTIDSDILTDAINDAVAQGIIVVAAAGNYNKNASYYIPGNISSVYTIGACDEDGFKTETSNYGNVVDYYVVAESTSLAAAKFSAYAVKSLDYAVMQTDVFDKLTESSDDDSAEIEDKTDAEEETEETEEYTPISNGNDLFAQDWTEINGLPGMYIEKSSDERSSWGVSYSGSQGQDSIAMCLDPNRHAPQISDSTTFSVQAASESFIQAYYWMSNGNLDTCGGAHKGVNWSPEETLWGVRYLYHVNVLGDSWSSALSGTTQTPPYTEAQLSSWVNEVVGYGWPNQTGTMYNWSDGTSSTAYRTYNSNYYSVVLAQSNPTLSLSKSSFTSDSDWTWNESTQRYEATFTVSSNFDYQFVYLTVPSGFTFTVNNSYTYNAGDTAILWEGDTVKISGEQNKEGTTSGQGRLETFWGYILTANDANQQRLGFIINRNSPSVSLTLKTGSAPYYWATSVKKVDNTTGNIVTGVGLDVYTSDHNTKIGTMTELKDSSGRGTGVYEFIQTTATPSPPTTVSVKETSAPGNYNNSLNVGKFFDNVPVYSSQSQISSGTVASHACLTATQTYDAYVSIKKVDGSNNNNLGGCGFRIYDQDNNTIATGTSRASDGMVIFSSNNNYYLNVSALYKAGKKIYMVETSAPSGWSVNTVPKEITPKVTTNPATDMLNAPSITAKDWKTEIKLKKSSSNPSYTNGNPNYSLANAEFTIYTDSARTNSIGVLTTNADGDSNTLNVSAYMNKNASGDPIATTFYYKETKNPKGFVNAAKQGSVTVNPGQSATFTETNTGGADLFSLIIDKKDSTNTDKMNGQNTLEGAEFTVKYYPQDTTGNFDSSKAASQTWIFKTIYNPIDEVYEVDFDETHLISNNRTYMTSTGLEVPYGFITIQETKAPQGYKTNGDFTIGNISADSNGVMVFKVDANGESGLTASGTYSRVAADGTIIKQDQPVRADIIIKKKNKNDEPMEGVEFEIKCNETGETVKVVTDDEGKFSTAKTYAAHSDNTNAGVAKCGTWFGDINHIDENVGALYEGTYTITELRCDANKNEQLEKAITITVNATTDSTVIPVYDANAQDADEYIWNYPFPLIHTDAIVVETNSKTLGQAGAEDDPTVIDYTNQTIEDDVYYENLRADTDFVAVAELMVIDTDGNVTPYTEDDGNGNQIPYVRLQPFHTDATYDHSRYEKTGNVTVTLDSIDPTGFEGQKFVVYETIYLDDTANPYQTIADIPDDANALQYDGYDTMVDANGNNISGMTSIFPIRHNDPDDTRQQVYPGDIHTTIMGKETGDHIGFSGTEKFVDRCFYTGLTIGNEYTITGTVHYKEIPDGATDDILRDADGNPVTSSKTFTAEANEGYVDIEFEIAAEELMGERIVCFEDLEQKGQKLVIHADISDEDEYYYIPSIHTSTRNSQIDAKDITDKNADSAKEVLAAEGESFTDTITYNCLIANREFHVVGVLMDKATGEVMKDATGKEITAETTFKTPTVGEVKITDSPDAKDYIMADGTVLDMSADHADYLANGSIDLEFSGYDFTNLANKTGVVYESVYLVKTDSTGGKKEYLVGEHKDITDIDQFTYFIEVGTQAIDKETDAQIVPFQATTSIIDTVSFKNAIVGKTYKLTASIKVVNDKSGKYKDGDDLLDKDGKPITVDFEFTAPAKDGEVEVEVGPFDTTNLANLDLVIFEDMYNEFGIKVGGHNSLEDRNQTVRVPDGHTTALGDATKQHVINADKEVKITDTIAFENLQPNVKYSATGTLYQKDTNKPLLDKDGKEITNTVEFTPTEPNGSVEIPFTIDSSLLVGKSIVCFEDVKTNGISVFIHADISDESQTTHVPGGHTTATDEATKDHVARATKEVTIVDNISYTNLVTKDDEGNAIEYTVTGKLMSKTTGKAITDKDGKEITSTVTFKPETSDGFVEAKFTFDSSLLQGETIVIFENMYLGTELIWKHESLEDSDQTVYIPKIGTTATVDDGKKSTTASKTTKITDTVRYSNLCKGTTYKLHAVLMNKSTGKPLMVNGKEVTADKTFVAESEAGSVDITIEFDSTGLSTDVVVFEYCYHNDVEVATHTELEDEGQTVTITPPVSPPKTGMALFLVIISLIGIGATGMLIFKRRKHA